MDQSKTSGNPGPPFAAASGWAVFASEAQRDLLVWVLSFGFLGSFRLIMILAFRSQLQPGHGASDILQALLQGARFDSMVATYAVLPGLLFSVGSLFKDLRRVGQPVRAAAVTLALAAHLALCGITVGYFQEYHDQFNQWIIGLVTDDLNAIWLTIWRSYPVLWYALAYGSFVAASAWAAPKVLRRFQFLKPERVGRWPPAARVLTVLLLGGLLFLAARGWGIRRPIKQHDLSVTKDAFLNKLVANPYVALRYAIIDYRHVTSAQGLSTFLGDRSIIRAAQTIFPNAGSWRDLDVLCQRKAAGHPNRKPRHIFLIVCESLDTWPMLPAYEGLGWADGLVQLAANGICCRAFVSSGSATSHATGTLASGLPEVGVDIHYQPSSRQPFPTASAPIFKRLGYRSRFIYAGVPSWQRADAFCFAQGFDEVLGIPDFKHLPSGAGTWGLPDEFLYEHILREISPDVPSFNLLLTTVNHPPFDLDVFAHGFPHHTMPERFEPLYDHGNAMKVFGHKWYTAKCASDFINAADQRFPGSLFVVTGDHNSRRFLNAHPSLFETKAVPCIFWGPAVLAGVKPPLRMAGSHTDLVPTLVELCADAGFEYAAFGRDLFKPDAEPVGFGARTVITPEFLLPVGDPNSVEAVPGQALPRILPALEELSWQYQSLHALSWWRAMIGSRLTPAN